MAFLKNTLFALVLIGFALLSADFAASRITLEPLLREACKAGMRVDARDRRDVVVELRRQDPNWFPAVPANTYIEHRLTDKDSTRIVPLGGVANAQVIGCTDSGYFSTFSTDPYGFNNPPRAWESGPKKKLYFVGDSFTQGDCRRPGETIVDNLRAAVPGVINLGSGGDGPLLELATIREYVPRGSVATVFWMYYEGNDLVDMRRDMHNEVLVHYLDPAFSQNLRARQSEVNGIVRRYVDKLIADYQKTRPVFIPALRRALWNASDKISFLPQKEGEPETVDIGPFEKVLARAKADVEARGGQLVFVYLPEYSRYAGQAPSPTAARRHEVLALVAELHIQAIDIDATIRGLPAPLAVYPFKLKAHYNPDGTRLIARTLENFIRSGAGATIPPPHLHESKTSGPMPPQRNADG
jgi:hypothetical protein